MRIIWRWLIIFCAFMVFSDVEFSPLEEDWLKIKFPRGMEHKMVQLTWGDLTGLSLSFGGTSSSEENERYGSILESHKN